LGVSVISILNRGCRTEPGVIMTVGLLASQIELCLVAAVLRLSLVGVAERLFLAHAYGQRTIR
jgi:hypothetical protein